MLGIKDKQIKLILKLLTAYGVIQVLAQDLGIKTGKKQRDFIQSPPMQLLILFATARTMTKSYKLALAVVIMYYALKYVLSEGETSEVCFEDV